MHYPGIVSYSGMAVGRSGFSTPSAQPFRPAAETQRISAVQAEDRRHVRDLLIDRENAAAPAFGTELVSQADIATSFNPPRGGMMLSFLAQHIAQEVSPEIAGPERYGSATNAYIGARDFNIEMLPDGAGVDIRIWRGFSLRFRLTFPALATLRLAIHAQRFYCRAFGTRIVPPRPAGIRRPESFGKT